MSTVFQGVRKGDVVLAVLMTGLMGLLSYANVVAGPAEATRIDSHSLWQIPVWAAAGAVVLWRRRNMLAVLGVTAALMVVHLAAFGALVRCGSGLPLSFVLAYGAGRLVAGRASWLALALTILVNFLVLVRDTAAGMEILPVTAVICLVAWGVGQWLQRRAESTLSTSDRVRVGAHA